LTSSVEHRFIGEVARLERRAVDVNPSREYEEIGIRSFGRGIFHKGPVSGAALGSKRVFWIKPADLVLNNVFAWEGAIAVADIGEQGLIGSHRFMTYVVDRHWAEPRYLLYYFLSDTGLGLIRRASPGSAGRNRTLGIKAFESLEIPLPPLVRQHEIASQLDVIRSKTRTVEVQHAGVAQKLAGVVTALVTRGDLSDMQKVRRGWSRRTLAEVIQLSSRFETVNPDSSYRIAGVYSFGRGLIDRGLISGSETRYRSLARLAKHNIVVSRLGGWEGAVAVVGSAFAGAYVSPEYPVFTPNQELLNPDYFNGIAMSPWLWDAIGESTRGSMARRKRIKAEQFLQVEIWLPPVSEQGRIAILISKALAAVGVLQHGRELVSALDPAALNRAFADLG
jgi:type I restriction enzyme S subunit